VSLKNLHPLPDAYLRGQPRLAAEAFHPINPRGHAHFAQRAALSRRGFLGMTAAASGLLFGGLAAPPVAEAARKGSSTPKPIPGGVQPLGPGTEIFHINLPAPGFEPSTITDFNGVVGVANVGGKGTQTDTNMNTSKRLAFDVDVRFMRGVYVGEDGRVHRNAFVFV
jgi:hypothetical protein